MYYIILFVYFSLYYFSAKNNTRMVLFLLPLFTLSFTYYIFGSYVISLSKNEVNIYPFIISFVFFSLQFFSLPVAINNGILGVAIWGGGLSLLPFIDILFPLNPLIITYPQFNFILPTSQYPFINLFLLFTLPCILFLKYKKNAKIILITALLSLTKFYDGANIRDDKSRLKIAIVQVGLYYEKGGSTTNFFNDLKLFLDRNPGIELVVFSENSLYGFKTEYNSDITKELFKKISQERLDDKYHIIMNLYGFHDINNVVTLYKHNGKEMINQKRVLIPFVEKRGVLNRRESLFSDFLYVDSKIERRIISYKNNDIHTYICYDALFPLYSKSHRGITIIQSDYSRLNSGNGYNDLLKYGTFLSKFSNGMSSNIVINIQNNGGTTVMKNGWDIDEKLFRTSLDEPFLIIE